MAAIKVLAKVQDSSEVLTGKGSAPDLMYITIGKIHFLWDIELRALVLSWLLFCGHPQFPAMWAFPTGWIVSSKQAREIVCQEDKSHSICSLIVEVIAQLLWHIPLVGSKSQLLPTLIGRRLHKCPYAQETWVIGGHLGVCMTHAERLSNLFFYPFGTAITKYYRLKWLAPLVTQTVKHLPAIRETHVWSLGLEHPLEKEMATHSSILAWKTPWTEEPSRL